MPAAIKSELDKIQRRFFMGRALLNRWIWRYSSNKIALWRRVVDIKYGGTSTDLLPSVTNYSHFSSLWRNIIKPLIYNEEFSETLSAGLGFSLGNGSSINFWDVDWIPGVILKLSFPRIYALAVNKGGKVKEYGNVTNNKWHWKIDLRRRLFNWEIHQWSNLIKIIDEFVVCENLEEKLIWKGSASGYYTVNQFCKDHIGVNAQEQFNREDIWLGLAPPKVFLLATFES
ncbi:hypothetical protein DITRI_Ditri13aG0150800 [Diplodiscus trichospermus]